MTQVGMVPTVAKVYGEQAPVSAFVGPEIVDGVPSEGVAADLHRPAVHRLFRLGHRQGGQRPAA